MDLQVEQAKREAQRRLEEERKRAENFEQARQWKEHRRIREHEYDAEKLQLEAQLNIPTKDKGDAEDIESCLRDFEDAEDKTVYRDIKPQISENVENRESPDVPLLKQNTGSTQSCWVGRESKKKERKEWTVHLCLLLSSLFYWENRCVTL